MIRKAVEKIREFFNRNFDPIDESPSVEDYDPDGWPGAPKDLPHALQKSFVDPFDYAVILRDGKVIEYESAQETIPGWIFLSGIRSEIAGCTFDRGLEIRVDDIVACADAPHGS